MRKKIFGRHLSRGGGARKALFRSQVRSLVEHGFIKTTQAKAKSVKSSIEKLMKLVRTNTVSSKRAVFSILANDKKTVEGIFNKYGLSANQRKSGFTRIINLGPRKGDAAPLVKLEMVDEAVKVEPKAKKPKKEAKAKITNKVKTKVKVKAVSKAGRKKK